MQISRDALSSESLMANATCTINITFLCGTVLMWYGIPMQMCSACSMQRAGATDRYYDRICSLVP